MLMDETKDFKLMIQNQTFTCTMDEMDVCLVDDGWN